MRRLCGWGRRRISTASGTADDFTRSLDEVFSTGSSHHYVAIGGTDFKPSTRRSPGPVTVIQADTPCIDKEWLCQYIENLEKCIVYNRYDFLTGLVVTSSQAMHQTPTLTKGAEEFLTKFGNEWVEFTKQTHGLVPGPYVLTDSVLKSVLRLLADKQSTCLTALRPLNSTEAAFTPLRVGGGQYPGRLSLGVPSTAASYVKGSPSLPPLRIVVKDCYYLKGMKNSLCNSAYYSFSPNAPFTATVVDCLIKSDGGAHVLGAAKLSTMVGREEPMDAVDFSIAFNPRGDGYQSPAGSSSGSAAAVASYKFIDAAIGTDTSGSGRRPALVNGVWQFRPSHHEGYLHGMVTTYPRFDTPAVFARDFKILKQIASVWTDTIATMKNSISTARTATHYTVIYPTDYLPVPNNLQMELVDSFISDMESSSSVQCIVKKLNIRQTWKATHPEGTPDDIEEYLDEMVTRTFYYGFYHAFDKFRTEYPLAHDGRPPYVIPFVRRRWEKGAAVTPAENKEAERRMEIYRQWWMREIFGHQTTKADDEKEKETMVILPIANVGPNYRDEVVESPGQQSALDQLFLSPILGAPDVMVPLGDVPYESKITGRTEYLPVLVNLVGAPGSDIGLLDVVENVMRDSKRDMVISTGSRMFSRQ
ncbi:amidase signature domain protein [Rhypophila sp. PSN 637]